MARTSESRLFLEERGFELPRVKGDKGLLNHLRTSFGLQIADGSVPVRAVITDVSNSTYRCEVGLLGGLKEPPVHAPPSIFEFRKRRYQNAEHFNVVLLVPTGIGAEIGGHAGDAGPVAQMLGELSDQLILHPNVVNASDINEMPPNSLYVEGSVITRLLMGSIGLQRVRANRLLVIVDAHPDELFVNAAINSVSGARATYGLQCSEVVCLDPPVQLRANYSPSGRATGRIDGLEGLCALLQEREGDYDAVAISSVVQVPTAFHQAYFDAGGEMVNPWGGVEAMLTHFLSTTYNIPTAHSPMLESREVANMDPGIVEPRMAAEAVSTTFLQCSLKGLQRSPRILSELDNLPQSGVLTAEDIACLVIPDGVLGLPTLAALEQAIPVIAVGENRNLMKNDLSVLPWAAGQFYRARNYWEAAGLVAALRAGIDPLSVRRPIASTPTSRFSQHDGPQMGPATEEESVPSSR